MKNCLRICLMVCLTVFFFSCLFFSTAAALSPENPIIGMMVRSDLNIDFPSKSDLPSKYLQNQLHELVDYAVKAGYNSLFFEVRTQGGALYHSTFFPSSRFLVREQGNFSIFDPLRQLITIASSNNIDVYAVIDPFNLGNDQSVLQSKYFASLTDAIKKTEFGFNLDPSHDGVISTNALDIKQLWDRYGFGLSGIIFQNMDAAFDGNNSAKKLLHTVGSSLNDGVRIGVLLTDSKDKKNKLEQIKDDISIVLADIEQPVGVFSEGFETELMEMKNASDGLAFVPYYDINEADSVSGEYSTRVFIAQSKEIESRLYNSYSALRFGRQMQGPLLASLANELLKTPEDLSFVVPQKLTITRPNGKLTTSMKTYSIFGTSNPDEILFLNGKAVERPSSDGIFAVKTTLQLGNNIFTFKQGVSSKTETINRISDQVKPSVISTIRSMAPLTSAIARVGEALELRCVAPSGSTVTANVAGNFVALKQSAAASPGIAAVFTGSLVINTAPEKTIQELGVVSYSLSNNGELSYYKSAGNMYLVDKFTKPFVRVTEHVASVFYDEKTLAGSYKEVYKLGTTEEVTGQDGETYALASGGFIRKDTVEVLTDELPFKQRIETIAAIHNERSENFILTGAFGLPYSIVENDDGSTTISFFGDIALPEIVDTTSSLFSKIEWNNLDNGIGCILIPKSQNSVWGLDVLYRENSTTIYAKRSPVISDSFVSPLNGIVVVLDPGHGGKDPGALGILGEYFPTERELNFANALMLKGRLEQLGATVVLTRESNEQGLALYERMAIAQDVLPDFFISLHHNSIAESSDVHAAKGVESYYYYNFGKILGENVTKKISQENYERVYRHVSWSYYTVTRMRYTPSILTEIAFMPHPIEYKRASDTIEIYKTANAIACALLESISSHS